MINQDAINQNLEFRDIPNELLESLELLPIPTAQISDQDKRKYISEFPALWTLCGGKGDYKKAQVKAFSKLNKKGITL